MNFNEKIPFNIEKIAKHRKIPKKNPKKFENAQKVKFSGHCQFGNLKNFLKNQFGAPGAPKMNIWAPGAPKNAKIPKMLIFIYKNIGPLGRPRPRPGPA